MERRLYIKSFILQSTRIQINSHSRLLQIQKEKVPPYKLIDSIGETIPCLAL